MINRSIKPLPHTWLGAYYDLEASPPPAPAAIPCLALLTPYPPPLPISWKPRMCETIQATNEILCRPRIPNLERVGPRRCMREEGPCSARSPVPDLRHPREHLPLPCKARVRLVMRAPAYINIRAFVCTFRCTIIRVSFLDCAWLGIVRQVAPQAVLWTWTMQQSRNDVSIPETKNLYKNIVLCIYASSQCLSSLFFSFIFFLSSSVSPHLYVGI